MKGTHFLTAAYKWNMEVFLLLLLLTLPKDGSSISDLHSFLNFYKENRELLRSIATDLPSALAPSARERQAPPAENIPSEEKSRPEKVGNASVLEEYLRRASL